MFVENSNDIYNSVIAFQKASLKEWREILSSKPIYFVHIKNERHYFGLSKFCAWKDITIEEYIEVSRYNSNGYVTKNYIARVLDKKEWIPYKNISKDIASSFENWIHSFYPNYKVENARFLSVKLGNLICNGPTNRKATPKILDDMLKRQKIIGEIGEKIVYKNEVDIIKKKMRFLKKYVVQESLINVSAGYDIYVNYEGYERFIEVKTTTKEQPDIYLSENEKKVLLQKGDKAYLYLVKVTNITKEKGKIIRIIRNPIKAIIEGGKLIPVSYKIELPDNEL